MGHEHMKGMEMGQPLPGQSIYNLSSEWTNQNNAAIKLVALRGRPVVRLGAEALQSVLLDAIHRRLAARVKIALQDPGHVLRARHGRKRNRNQRKNKAGDLAHRLVPGPR